MLPGIQWNILFKPYNPDGGMSLGMVMVMLTVDSLIYLLITIYVEAVFPGEFGVPKPWNFLCKASFWCTTINRRKYCLYYTINNYRTNITVHENVTLNIQYSTAQRSLQ